MGRGRARATTATRRYATVTNSHGIGSTSTIAFSRSYSAATTDRAPAIQTDRESQAFGTTFYNNGRKNKSNFCPTYGR